MADNGAGRAVGFVGLGLMGRPMAARLVQAGISVRGFDVSPSARSEAAESSGVIPASDLRDVGSGADVIILMLPNSDAVENVLVGRGLLAALAPGATVVDMSSSEPLRTRALAERAGARRVTLLDAPVSGGVAGAESGALTIMVGGREDAVDNVRWVLEPLGKRIVRIGDVGAGHAAKALNNLMSAAHLLVTSEAMLSAKEFGLDVNVVLDAVNGASGRSGSTETKWPKFIVSERYDSGFTLGLMVKDMSIAVEMERSLGVPGALSEAALTLWKEAGRFLPSDADHTEIVRWLEHRKVERSHDG